MKDSILSQVKDINKLRGELHQLIESENLTSSIVQQRSRELDVLILLYYQKKDYDLSEP